VTVLLCGFSIYNLNALQYFGLSSGFVLTINVQSKEAYSVVEEECLALVDLSEQTAEDRK
jgi:hypothetical protein